MNTTNVNVGPALNFQLNLPTMERLRCYVSCEMEDMDTEPIELEESDEEELVDEDDDDTNETYESEEVEAVTLKIIRVLKIISREDPIPYSVLMTVHQDSNLVRLALEEFIENRFVKLDPETEMAEPFTRKIEVYQLVVPKVDKIALLREILNKFSPFLTTSTCDDSAFEKVLPHALSLWKEARIFKAIRIDFDGFPMQLMNRLDKVAGRYCALKYLEFSKTALEDYACIYQPNEFKTFRLKFHVASALRRLERHREAWKILISLVPEVKKCLPSNHWLTIDIIRDFVYALRRRKNFVRAYQEQEIVCHYYSNKNGESEKTAEEFFINAQIMCSLDMFVEAEKAFREVLDWKLRNGDEAGGPDLALINIWIKKCEIGIRVGDAQALAEEILIANGSSELPMSGIKKILRAAKSMKRNLGEWE